MDLVLFLRVLKRFSYLLIPGLILAGVLGYSEYRHTSKSKQWVSYGKVFVTQSGFPWGSLGSSQSAQSDQVRLTSLAILYSQLATSDSVQTLVAPEERVRGSFQVAPVLTQQESGEALPLISIAAIDDSPQSAVALARSEITALLTFIRSQQARNDIPLKQRVILQVVQKPTLKDAKVFSNPSKAVPIVIFLTVLMAVIALSFILENLRPRARAEAVPSASSSDITSAPSAASQGGPWAARNSS